MVTNRQRHGQAWRTRLVSSLHLLRCRAVLLRLRAAESPPNTCHQASSQHCQQDLAQGEWTDEEHELFQEAARKQCVGDKWGRFASYLPQRVGYQCSAYYRDVMIARGLILDKRFKLTASGSVGFVG